MERHVIIGTAGHIDHGKTTLVKALTGRDTDRLKEEKARGITIDLGFTWMDLTDGERVGIIDVPGHEKFIANMTAGVVGMDLVLLFVSGRYAILGVILRSLLVVKLIVSIYTALALLFLVASQAGVILASRRTGHHAQSLILGSTLILLPHPSYLLDVHTILHQLGNNLSLRSSGIMFLNNKFHDLLIGHRLCHQSHRNDYRQNNCNDISFHISLYFKLLEFLSAYYTKKCLHYDAGIQQQRTLLQIIRIHV